VSFVTLSDNGRSAVPNKDRVELAGRLAARADSDRQPNTLESASAETRSGPAAARS
jgi:hypothetical protein